MTQQTERATFEDGAWYWVEKEGWIGDPPTIAPARYSAGGDSWNSFSFSGIPTREVKVLEPCRRAALEVKQAVQWPEPAGWRNYNVLTGATTITGKQESELASEAVYTEQQVRAMLQASQNEKKLDFTKPLETTDGKPVKWVVADVIEYNCARI